MEKEQYTSFLYCVVFKVFTIISFRFCSYFIHGILKFILFHGNVVFLLKIHPVMINTYIWMFGDSWLKTLFLLYWDYETAWYNPVYSSVRNCMSILTPSVLLNSMVELWTHNNTKFVLGHDFLFLQLYDNPFQSGVIPWESLTFYQVIFTEKDPASLVLFLFINVLLIFPNRDIEWRVSIILLIIGLESFDI